MSDNVRIHRTAQSGHFTVLPNALIEDDRLGPFALGVLVRVLSGEPVGTADLRSERYRAALAQLEELGYLNPAVTR